MLKKLTALTMLLPALAARAQIDPANASVYLPAINNAIAVYNNFRGDESNLYNGLAQEPYELQANGTPYFGTGDWFKGKVQYDNVIYQNAILKYDLVRDLLLVQNPASRNSFSLFKPRVDWFTLGDRMFVNLKKGMGVNPPAEGYYEQLCQGSITLFEKWTKSFQETLANNSIDRHVEEKTKFYALKDGVFYPIPGVKALFKLTKDRKGEIKKQLKRNHIKPRRNLQTGLAAIAQYYNQLSH